MPPPGANQPEQKDIDSFVAWMENRLDTQATGPKAGYVGIQRLTRTEYVAAVKALVGVDVTAKDVLPSDVAIDGFDNIASVLSVSPTFVEQYVESARMIAKKAIGDSGLDNVMYPLRTNTGAEAMPLGLRDGFGERGRFDSRVLFYQTIHRRPIAGGFVARLPPRIVAAYDADRILGPLLRLSEGQPLASERTLEPSEGSDALIAHGFRFVVIDRELAPRDLLAFTDRALKLREIARDGNRVLYEVAPGVNGG